MCNSFTRRLPDSALTVENCAAPLRAGFLVCAGPLVEYLNGVYEQCVTNFLIITQTHCVPEA